MEVIATDIYMKSKRIARFTVLMDNDFAPSEAFVMIL